MSDLKEPTKSEFTAALAGFIGQLMIALIDGKISVEEFENLGAEFANAGMKLYGINWKFVKVIPTIHAKIPILEG